ncbi:MAG TPA: hypothetical protein VGH89_22880 [Pseudonocardia sp.]|jgi:hypothetical protein
MSPAPNRVTPWGTIEAIPLRGAFTGNRGIIHSGPRTISRFHAHNSWVTCALEFRGRWNEQWIPHRLTWLYFHDEAISMAAGHRPCNECRHASYVAYRSAWADGLGVAPPSAKDMNRQLHGERLVRGTRNRKLHDADWIDLPTGAFVRLDAGRPAVVVDDRVVEWTSEGYRTPWPRPARGTATVITPPSTVAVLRAGYPVQIDDSARAATGPVDHHRCAGGSGGNDPR